jgi:catechol 2,3-dioxygenase-like lactoylglutathione lyase family enzyme
MRVQLALNVPDLEKAISYYSKMFGTQPHKRREGYANFAIDAPPLKLVLFENPDAEERLNHLGVEVFEPSQVDDAMQRLDKAGILESVQTDTLCCHATQDKIWSRAHDGLQWEWYRISDDEPAAEYERQLGKVCCGGA